MFGQRFSYNRVSQLQHPRQASRGHEREHFYFMQQRGLHGYATRQRGYAGVSTHRPNYANHQTHQRHGGSGGTHQQHHGRAMPKPNSRIGASHRDAMIAARHHHYRASCNTNEVDSPPKQPSHLASDSAGSNRLVRAIRGAATEDSLFPHGLSFAEDYLHEWDQRPECPRPKWDFPENPSWQPPVMSRTEEYSNTELIRTSAAAISVSCQSSTHFYKFDWQVSLHMLSSKDPASDYNSDSSSVK